MFTLGKYHLPTGSTQVFTVGQELNARYVTHADAIEEITHRYGRKRESLNLPARKLYPMEPDF